MSAKCPKCESLDQVISIKAILGTSAMSESYSGGMAFRGSQVTPMMGRTTYIDDGLLNLQDAAKGFINWPRDKYVDLKKYSFGAVVKRRILYPVGLLVTAQILDFVTNHNFIVFATLSGLSVYSIIGLLLYAKFWAKKGATKRANKLVNDADRMEQQMRYNGWFCKRCSNFFK